MSTRRRRYDEDNLKMALEAVKNGMPFLKASNVYNVPRSTLRHKIAGRAPENIARSGPQCVLGEKVENEIVKWIKECAHMGFPIKKDGLFYSIKKIVAEMRLTTPFKDKSPGKKWFALFMARHPELAYKQSEYLNSARACLTEKKIRTWFSNTLELLGEDAKILVDPKRIWNMDETAFFLNPTGGCVIAEKGKFVYGTSSNSNKENVTTLITVNAEGDFAPPLTLYKFERLPLSYIKLAPPKWGIGKSKNRWMTAETFLQYFENVFYKYLIERNAEFPVIVFLDGHTSHLSIHLCRFCRERQIIVICLHPNATHILQPLDVAVFYPLKARWKKEVSLWRLENNGEEIKKKTFHNCCIKF